MLLTWNAPATVASCKACGAYVPIFSTVSVTCRAWELFGVTWIEQPEQHQTQGDEVTFSRGAKGDGGGSGCSGESNFGAQGPYDFGACKFSNVRLEEQAEKDGFVITKK